MNAPRADPKTPSLQVQWELDIFVLCLPMPEARQRCTTLWESHLGTACSLPSGPGTSLPTKGSLVIPGIQPRYVGHIDRSRKSQGPASVQPQLPLAAPTYTQESPRSGLQGLNWKGQSWGGGRLDSLMPYSSVKFLFCRHGP